MASSPYASHNNEGFGVSCIQLHKIFDILIAKFFYQASSWQVKQLLIKMPT